MRWIWNSKWKSQPLWNFKHKRTHDLGTHPYSADNGKHTETQPYTTVPLFFFSFFLQGSGSIINWSADPSAVTALHLRGDWALRDNASPIQWVDLWLGPSLMWPHAESEMGCSIAPDSLFNTFMLLFYAPPCLVKIILNDQRPPEKHMHPHQSVTTPSFAPYLDQGLLFFFSFSYPLWLIL